MERRSHQYVSDITRGMKRTRIPLGEQRSLARGYFDADSFALAASPLSFCFS